jgi:hypothetical protein
LLALVQSLGVLWCIAYRDKKVVNVFVRFRAPLHALIISLYHLVYMNSNKNFSD